MEVPLSEALAEGPRVGGVGVGGDGPSAHGLELILQEHQADVEVWRRMDKKIPNVKKHAQYHRILQHSTDPSILGNPWQKRRIFRV